MENEEIKNETTPTPVEPAKPEAKEYKTIKDLSVALNVLGDGLDALAGGMMNFEERIKALEGAPTPMPVPRAVSPASGTPVDINKMVPQEWLDVVHEVLNPAFGVEVTYRPDACFEFVIFVPKEYSNAKPDEWVMAGADRRIRVISNALNVIGIRDWAEKVAANLGKEIMYRVQNDRARMVK